MKSIISLIGQQPIPNLLPILDLEADTAVLVHSDFSEPAYHKLRKLLEKKGINAVPLLVDAYDMLAIQDEMEDVVAREGFDVSNLTVNITGGTKFMSLAAYRLAAKLTRPFVYLQSEEGESVLYEYTFTANGALQRTKRKLPPLITIDDYLRVHAGPWVAGGFTKHPAGRPFEEAIFNALEPAVDEIENGVQLTAVVDIDFVVRCGNQVGIVEAKTGSNGIKKAIGQLTTAGGQQYLGTYTKRFLVSDQDWQDYSNLKELAEARNITVIQLPGFAQTKSIDEQETRQLREAVLHALGQQKGPG